jgi:hypothetical protein
VLINEVMAKNSSGLTDEQGEYEDWIELYNSGSEAINLAGLFLSDTMPAYRPWQIPCGYPQYTTIMPGSYLVFFADNDTVQGVMHAGFKLDRDGDDIALLQASGKDTIIIDQLSFGRQSENISLGRYPDGSTVFEFMPLPTPGAANYMEPDNTAIHSPTSPDSEITVYPVPASGDVFIKFNRNFSSDSEPVRIRIYSSTGKLVSETEHPASGIIGLSIEGQPEGLYLLSILSGGRSFEKRIVVY